MRIHFFTAPFYFAFIWFRVQGSGFKVQGSRFKGEVAASPPFLEDGILVSQPSPRGEGLGGATLRVDFYKRRCPKVVGIAIRRKRISNIWGGANPVSLRSTAPSRGRG